VTATGTESSADLGDTEIVTRERGEGECDVEQPNIAKAHAARTPVVIFEGPATRPR
jgi:hypothetical protein